MTTICVGISNSDDKLSQTEWVEFYEETAGWVEWAVSEAGGVMHCDSWSVPNGDHQCMRIVAEVPDPAVRARLKRGLSVTAGRYRQDSIAWLEGEAEFLRPPTGARPVVDRG